MPVDPALLRAGQIVADLVYHPLDTALLRAARAAGARAVDGLGMLVHQAAHSFRLWTGVDAPVTVMREAALAELAARARPSSLSPARADPARTDPARSGPRRYDSRMLRYLTAGESHGQALVVIVEGLPAGLPITEEEVASELARRRLGYGRGPRQRFEADELTLVGGVRHGRTLGSPVAIEIKNSEWFRSDKWHEEMSPAPGSDEGPAHAGAAGARRSRRHAEVRLHRRP